MASHNRVLTDHDEIRKWAEERGAKPARVKGTGSKDDPGVLRLERSATLSQLMEADPFRVARYG